MLSPMPTRPALPSRLKPILLGLLAGALAFVALQMIAAQYADYRALSNSEDLLAALRPVQQVLDAAPGGAQAATEQAEQTLRSPSGRRIGRYRVLHHGMIVAYGDFGQLLLLMRSGKGWTCAGGSPDAVPRACRSSPSNP